MNELLVLDALHNVLTRCEHEGIVTSSDKVFFFSNEKEGLLGLECLTGDCLDVRLTSSRSGIPVTIVKVSYDQGRWCVWQREPPHTYFLWIKDEKLRSKISKLIPKKGHWVEVQILREDPQGEFLEGVR